MGILVDGKRLAEDLYGELLEERRMLSPEVRLGIVVVGENPVIESFIARKKMSAERLNVTMVRTSCPESATTREVIDAVEHLVASTSAVIAQLPMPPAINIEEVLAATPPSHDVDATNPLIPHEDRLVHAPVALGIVEILTRNAITIAGARIVVVGAGRLVGEPTAWLLRRLGGDVSVVTLEQGSLDDLKDADIVVSGAGSPGLIKPGMVKEGVVLIDAGTAEMNKKIQGDIDAACYEKARLATPVPGGVGPVAVSKIFTNLFTLIRTRENL